MKCFICWLVVVLGAAATAQSQAQVSGSGAVRGSQAQGSRAGVAAAVTPQSPLDEAKAAIAASNAIYFQAFSKGDSSIFVNRYAKDCWIMAPDAQALCGEDAALDFWRIAYYQIGLRNGRFITTDIFGDGIEYVTEVGFWQSFDKDNKIFDNGKFLVLWKKTAQGWKMFRDSFSSDRGGKEK